MSVIQRHRPRRSKLIANKHRILSMIFREGSCSRLYLARKLNMNASTIGNYVDDLLERGLLIEDHVGPTRRGRSPVPMWLNPDYGYFLGVDFEALRVRTVLTDFAGKIVAQKEVGLKAGLGREAVLKTVVDAAKQTAEKAQSGRLFALGIAAPGQVDCRLGRIVLYDLLPDFENVPLLDHFRPHFDCPVFVEENIRALTLAELLRGAGKGHRHFLCVAARSGIGMGIVINGQIYTGSHELAGKVGRTVLSPNDHPQTMTNLVSAKGIIRQALQLLKTNRKTSLRRSLVDKGDDLSLADLVAAADAGDRRIIDLLEQVGKNLGLVAANLANLFAPEKIILAGEVPSCCPLVRQTLELSFQQYTLNHILEHLVLADGALSGFAGAMGAAYLGFLKTFPEQESVSLEVGESLVLGAGR
ncbi:MAG TPA: ROK family transcriptional regulator [Isosphaeraceae bacterium]|nr:ROK family transcriptional regulator [Isosphaeraceae bacterium]